MKLYRLPLVWLAIILATGCASTNHETSIEAYRLVTRFPEPPFEEEATSLSFHDAILFANYNNERLAQQGEEYLRTLIQKRKSISLFLPSLELSPRWIFREEVSSGTGLSDSDVSNNVRSASDQKEVSFDLTADLTFTVFNGFRDMNSYWKDSFLAEQSRVSLLAFQESFLLDVGRVFYQTVQAEHALSVVETSLESQEERLRTTEGRYEAGLARALDVAQTRAQVSETRTALIEAKQRIATTRSTLELLTALPLSGRKLEDSLKINPVPEDLNDLLAIARAERDELRAAELAILAARREVDIAFGEYYPSVTLDVSRFLSRDSAPSEREWEGALRVNLPIFSAGRIAAEVEQAWSFFREALLVRSYLLRQVRQEVQTALIRFIGSREKLLELRIRRQASEQAYALSDASYRYGLATNLDRIVAQEDLLRAQIAEVSEEFNHKISYLELLQSLGRLGQEWSS